MDKRPDRLAKTIEILKQYNITNYERFSAIIPTLQNIPDIYTCAHQKIETYRIASYGCYLSHIAILKLAKSRNYKRILILEDDIEFSSEFTEIIPKALDEIEDLNWDLFYLGGNNYHNTKINNKKYICNVSRCYALHAYIVNMTCYNTLITAPHKREIDGVYVDLSHNNIIKTLAIVPFCSRSTTRL